MINVATGWPTALAVALAMTAAVCFAYGAFFQQRAVADVAALTAGSRAATGSRAGVKVGVQSFRLLAHQPRWLAGWAVVAGGTVLHALALLLAPVSVVQPIGILAVPVAVLLAARHRGARPGRPVVFGVVLAVAGTGGFVLLAGSAAGVDRSPVTLAGLLAALLIVAVISTCLEVAVRNRTGLVRCLGYAGIGAVSFGFGSALIHLIGQAVADGSGLLTPLVVIAALATASTLAVGAWAVQQAYAAGPSAVVVGALTVGDPLVAVLLSAGLLGGELSLAPVVVSAMVGCAATAALGVRLLASHHPDALPTANLAPVRELASVH
jgi:hypothetical protein